MLPNRIAFKAPRLAGRFSSLEQQQKTVGTPEPAQEIRPVEQEPIPNEPTRIEPTPIEPAPIEPTPIEPTPIEPTPIEPAPIEPIPTTTPADLPKPTIPVNRTFLGFYEELSSPVADAVKDLVYPVTVIGTRKPNYLYFFNWSFNNGLPFSRRLHNKLYLTYQDQSGKVFGPVAYSGNVAMRGPLFSFGYRHAYGFISGLHGHTFHAIPTHFNVDFAADAQVFLFSLTQYKLTPVYATEPANPHIARPPVVATYAALVTGLGLTGARAGSGSFQLMPYLFKPVWGFPEVTLLIACLALFALVSLYSALQLLILFVSWRLKRTKEKLDELQQSLVEQEKS